MNGMPLAASAADSTAGEVRYLAANGDDWSQTAVHR